MISREFRFALLGALMGLTVALVPSCGKKCAPDNCAGCCNSKNECVTDATTVAACGSAGNACAVCSEGQTCESGACVTPAPPDAGSDAGVIDAGPPPCTNDFDCLYLQNGSVCDSRTGKCEPGQGCQFDSECQSDDPENKCYRLGRQCICDQRDKPAGEFFKGTCRVRKSPCQECAINRECGDDPIIFGYPGIGAGLCKQLQGDSSGKKYCLYERIGQCACGTIDDGTGYCKPQSNSCNQVGCNIDKDCPSGSVCSVNNPDAGSASCGGICVPRCRWDFLTKQLVAPGCPPGNSCWVDSANLDPNSIYYGSGRCKPPCQNDNDCKLGGGNPFGGDNLKCAGEQLPGGGTSDKRCRANGECMDNAECPDLPDNQPYLGYCDRGAFQCKTDCRPGTDPVTGLGFKDCRPPYACSSDGGTNFCRLQTCVEQGGAGIACAQGEYCCGEDKNNDTIADPCPPPAERNAAGCYKAPAPPFCTAGCMSDDDCKNPQLPSWLSGSGACANGSKSPSCSALPTKCMYAGDRAPMQMGVNICAPSTYNDNTLDMVTQRRRANVGCPTNYQITWIRPAPNQNDDGYCQTNDDCSIGTVDGGLCETDTEIRLRDGGYGKSCKCTAGSGATQCPNSPPDAGTMTSTCKTGVSGQRTYCIESVVCMPPPGAAYKSVMEYGCGL